MSVLFKVIHLVTTVFYPLTNTYNMLEKNSIDLLLKKAKSLQKYGKHEEAVQIFDKINAAKNYSKNKDFWKNKGLIASELGNYKESIEYFDKDLQYNGDNFEIYYLKGTVLSKLGRHIEAIELFNKAVEIKYAECLKLDDKAKTMKDFGKFENAVLCFDKIKNTYPIPVELWYYKGLSFYALKKYDDADNCFSSALELNSNDSKIIHEKARSKFMMGRTDECLQLLKRSCQLDPTNKKYLMTDPMFKDLLDKQFM